MALKPCRECGQEVAESASTCPHCGVSRPVAGGAGAIVSGLLSLTLFLGMIWYFFGGGLDRQAASGMDDIYKKVASDAVEQYRITAKSGSAMDRCVQAGMVTAAFLQAKDDASYTSWKTTEDRDCKAAGLQR